MGRNSVVERQARDGEDPEGDEHRRNGGVEHVADVGEDLDAGRRRGQHRGVGEQRELVAEIGSRDDGSGDPSFRKAHRLADAHERHADGGDGGPRRSGHQRHHGADRARSHEEERRVEDLQSVINHRRDHARDHPRAGDGADQQQDDDGRRRGADVVDDGLFEHGPAAAVDADREHHADRRGRQQGDLASAVDGLAAEGADHDIEESRQHRQRNGRHPGRRQFFSIRLHILFLREAKVRRIFVLAPSGRPTCGLRPEETATGEHANKGCSPLFACSRRIPASPREASCKPPHSRL